MKQQRAIVLGGLLAAVVVVGVTGVSAQRAESGGRRSERVDRDGQRDWSPGMFVTQDGPDRRVLRLDGRGSQIGVMVRDGDGTDGVTIDAVDDGGPAAKAGVKAGDVVVDFDGERVRSARQLTRLVQETPPGRAVKMTVARAGARTTLDITPGSDTATWNFEFGPEMRAEIERGMRGLRNLPRPSEPMFDFRFDGIPALPGRGRLGVEVQTLSDQLGDYFGVKGGGVLVSTVRPDSPAAKAGVKAGDVITTVNGTAVRDAGELAEEIGRAAAKTDVTLGITRDRKTTTLKATLEPPTPRPGRRSRPA